MTVSRGYAVLMSTLNWLVVFVLTIKTYKTANILYGFLALIGIIFAHLGTNLFDDCIDYILKVPKQKCKTEYLENGFTTIKKVILATGLNFSIALFIGLFFFLKFGMPIVYLTLGAILIILTYPKLNNFALGEIAVGLMHGPLLFAGVNYVMTEHFDINILLISVPVTLLTIGVVYTHALMDFDFDKKSKKLTICLLLKNKNNALNGLMTIYVITFAITFYLVSKNILPILSILAIFIIPNIVKLYKSMKKYIIEPKNEDFMLNFITARNISIYYNLILVIIFLLEK